MIRRLRLKFVLMNMAFVTALLAAVFSLVLHTTRNELAQAGLRALEQAALEHLGPVRPDRRPGEPGGIPCFVLRTGPRGELIAAGDGYYDLTDEDWLLTLLAAAREQGRLDAARTSTARTLLTLELAGRTCNLVALLGLVGTLTLIGQVLLHVEIDSVVISLHAEDCVRKNYLTTGLFSLCVKNS